MAEKLKQGFYLEKNSCRGLLDSLCYIAKEDGKWFALYPGNSPSEPCCRLRIANKCSSKRNTDSIDLELLEPIDDPLDYLKEHTEILWNFIMARKTASALEEAAKSRLI